MKQTISATVSAYDTVVTIDHDPLNPFVAFLTDTQTSMIFKIDGATPDQIHTLTNAIRDIQDTIKNAAQ